MRYTPPYGNRTVGRQTNVVRRGGRWPANDYAEGLDIYELADFMWGIGSYDAVNYDGGGSSIMVLRDEDEKAKASFIVRNRPSDGSPRAVGNGLAIVEKD